MSRRRDTDLDGIPRMYERSETDKIFTAAASKSSVADKFGLLLDKYKEQKADLVTLRRRITELESLSNLYMGTSNKPGVIEREYKDATKERDEIKKSVAKLEGKFETMNITMAKLLGMLAASGAAGGVVAKLLGGL